MTTRAIIARPLNHEKMVKYKNTHIIKQRKWINTNHTTYNVENKYRQVKEGPESRRANLFHTYMGYLSHCYNPTAPGKYF